MRGTWQVTDYGRGKGVLIVLGVLVLLGSGTAARLAATVVEALIAAIVVVVLTIAAGVAGLVWYARRGHLVRVVAPPEWRQVPGAAPPKPVAAQQPQMIVNHYHGGVHLHGADAAGIIRKAPIEGAVIRED